MKLQTEIHTRGPGIRPLIASVEQAIAMIDGLPPEFARLPRWTFARALFLEAQRSGKSRDLNAAERQLKQALSNEKWLSD